MFSLKIIVFPMKKLTKSETVALKVTTFIITYSTKSNYALHIIGASFRDTLNQLIRSQKILMNHLLGIH